VSLGASLPRRDAPAKVTGDARYPGDLFPEGVLYAKIAFTDQPHARITALDTAEAEAVEGVLLVLTAADVPVNEYGLTMFDQPVLIGPVSTGRSSVPHDVSRWEADHLAVVVAETAEAADRAAARLRPAWEPLAVVADIDAALAPDAPLLHPENGQPTNAYHHYKVRKGDPSAGWDRADVVVEATYEIPYQEHAYLQPEAGLSYLDDEDRVTVVVAGQWTVEDQEQIAHALDLPTERVRVVYPAIGGAFGGREDMSVQIVLALATTKLAERGVRRPVRAQWSREESIVGHHKRHRARVHTRWGATRHGRITVVEADAWLDAGGYNYTSNKVLGNLHLCVGGPYDIPNARIDSRAVYTNAVPGGAFRGFGAPQGCFVAETQVNKVAEALGLDPVEVRRVNVVHEGAVGITGTELPPGVSLPEVVEACADAASWTEPLPERPAMRPVVSLPPAPGSIRRGRGFACAYKNIGFSFGFPERSEARIVLRGDGEQPEWAELYLGGAEVGQGAHTAFTQMAAEATGLAYDAIRPSFSDTATSGDSGSASASRLTWMTGNAVLGAAEEADKAWRNGDRPAVGTFRFTPPPTEPLDPDGGPSVPNFAYGYVAEAVQVSLDVGTGHVVVDDVVCAVDVGRAINPQLVVGQAEGAVVQAHGYILSEHLQVADARILNPRLSTYLIPGIGDIPEQVRTVILEIPDPRGPWGARGMAEMPMIPYAPAVVAALHDASGVWFDEFPLTPSRVVAALRAAGIGP
jgi:CO/xanthine dehydrogenase Mo-binding subunit